MGTSDGEMKFIVMSLVTQQNCISGTHLIKMAKKMLQYQGPYIWNILPEAVINSENVLT